MNFARQSRARQWVLATAGAAAARGASRTACRAEGRPSLSHAWNRLCPCARRPPLWWLGFHLALLVLLSLSTPPPAAGAVSGQRLLSAEACFPVEPSFLSSTADAPGYTLPCPSPGTSRFRESAFLGGSRTQDTIHPCTQAHTHPRRPRGHPRVPCRSGLLPAL